MITAENIFDDFKFTMSGLEKGLQVMHITTPAAQLRCCQYNDDIETVLAHPDLRPFDQIPVKRQETIIGLLKRRECPDDAKGLVREYMQPLEEKVLVSADTPLLEFIQTDPLDRIVIGNTKIYGLVTRSDFLKLPVSLLGFALVMHTEALMLNMIRATGIREETWLSWLHPQRRNDIRIRFAALTSQRSDPDILELTYFSDKHKILNQLVLLESYAPSLPNESILSQLAEIKILRNNLVHTGNNSEDNDNLQNLIDRLRLTHKWIEYIEQWQTSYGHITY